MKRVFISNIKCHKKNRGAFSDLCFLIKKITVVIVLLLLINPTYAQDMKKFRFGLKAAPNVSWLKPDNTRFEAKRDANKPALKFSYGLITEFGLTENYSFATGLAITTIGGSLNFPDSVYYIAGTAPDTIFLLNRRIYHLQYVDIPLTIKMRTNEIGYMKYFGQFGLNLAFRTKARSDDRGVFTDNTFRPGNEVDRPDRLDVSDETQLFRVALDLGAGIEYNLVGNTALLVSVNYSNGFTNALRKNSKVIIDKDKVDAGMVETQLEQRVTSNYVALNIGILF